MNEKWHPYFYQYIVGGLLFAAGILIAYFKGNFKKHRVEDIWTLKILILGFCMYAFIHGAWLLASN